MNLSSRRAMRSSGLTLALLFASHASTQSTLDRLLQSSDSQRPAALADYILAQGDAPVRYQGQFAALQALGAKATVSLVSWIAAPPPQIRDPSAFRQTCIRAIRDLLGKAVELLARAAKLCEHEPGRDALRTMVESDMDLVRVRRDPRLAEVLRREWRTDLELGCVSADSTDPSNPAPHMDADVTVELALAESPVWKIKFRYGDLIECRKVGQTIAGSYASDTKCTFRVTDCSSADGKVKLAITYEGVSIYRSSITENTYRFPVRGSLAFTGTIDGRNLVLGGVATFVITNDYLGYTHTVKQRSKPVTLTAAR